MKAASRVLASFDWIRLLPLSWLSLSLGQRWLLVALSYGLGIAGLWLFFPLTHNGTTMYVPIACACWLFRYRGLLLSLLLNGLAFQVAYFLLLRGLLPNNDYVIGGFIGLGTSLVIGLVVCWLRAAVDSARVARRLAMDAESARALIELRERQATLAYEQERKLNALQEQFLLNVSHELRTPLTILTGSLDLLVTFYEQMDSQMQMKLLKQAHAGQEELVTLVEQVLDASRVMHEIPLAKPEVVHVRDLLDQVVAALATNGLDAYTLRIYIDDQVSVLADPQFLRQILRNLLVNICKYVPSHTEICIEATQSNLSSSLCISIQDAGPGIPADELPLLFEKFVRLKRHMTSEIRGTGLGLYLCKQMTEAMGGDIWVESTGKPGEGSCFCLSLPISLPETPAVRSLIPSPLLTQNKEVL